MSDTEFGCSGSTSCSPSDCASCAGGCGGSDISSHRTITLTMEDDTEVECAILTIFPVDAKEYIALLPLDENGQNTDGEVYLYSFTRTESGDPMLANIEDDEEFCLRLLKKEKVLLVPGKGFNWNEPDHFRIVYLPRVEELADLGNKIERVLSYYKR